MIVRAGIVMFTDPDPLSLDNVDIGEIICEMRYLIEIMAMAPWSITCCGYNTLEDGK